MIHAAIDIGTITMLMLVTETEPKPEHAGVKGLFKTKNIRRVIENCIEYPKLGEGVHKNRRFSDEAMLRAETVFKKYADICKKHGVQKITAVATSASRDSSNSRDFFKRMKEMTGIEVRIIDGDKEARLSFLGGLLDWQDPKTHCLMDIGGGSTEFVALNETGDDVIAKSTDIGSIRATEMFLEGDPHTKASLERLEAGLKGFWQAIDAKLAEELRAKTWVAVAGTPTVMAAMALGISSFTSDKIDGHKLSRCEVFDIYEGLAVKTKAQRELIPLIGKQRADVIVAGVAILATAMEFFGKDEVVISTRGLRHGVLTSDEIA